MCSNYDGISKKIPYLYALTKIDLKLAFSVLKMGFLRNSRIFYCLVKTDLNLF